MNISTSDIVFIIILRRVSKYARYLVVGEFSKERMVISVLGGLPNEIEWRKTGIS